ncbi:AAA family ATPase [Epilithonimonas sp. JDS]|uniref:AAA family ATPase n=1 Tax=Epilithonimonas sp. JDS TaxID=2902797 RepID=UPI001E32A924|nr:AAA family ATPase [Epilithonimonas sp. JDS]MCD9855773.1 AAA family ATPase [Epilithonimonas sp. JDS]
MNNIPIYIKELNLSNIRTFGDVELKLENENGELSQWTLILGDNGIGKSTILQSIAWAKPQLPNNSDVGEILNIERIEPIISDEENSTLVKIVRNNMNTAKINAVFLADRAINSLAGKKKIKSCETKIKIGLTADRNLEEFDTPVTTNSEKFFLNNNIIIFAYSASRKLGNQNITSVDLEDSIPNFLKEQTELYDAEEILHTINYASLGADKKDKIKYERFKSNVIDMLVSILPDFENVESINISTPKLVNGILRQGQVVISTKYGESIPFSSFSLGYKNVISWTVDLAWRLFNQYPESDAPLSEPAIVLIDEIDQHLHPLWQNEIISNLTNAFPNIQFIATAHSPLMVQAAINGNYAVLQFDSNEGVKIINEPKGIDGWRVDQILTSEFFNLKSSRGPQYDQIFKEREKLKNKNKLSKSEKEKLKDLTEKLAQYPTGDNPEELENREIISALAKKIRDNKIPISL